MKHHKYNSSTGFTILELLIVIAIIGVLVAIFVISQTTARNKAHNATTLVQIEEYVKAIELYYTDEGIYPSGYSDDTPLTRTGVFCIYDGHNNANHCMPAVVSNRQTNTPTDSLVREALKNYMSELPKLEHVPGSALASPAYSGCTYSGGTPSCNPDKDFSFWFLLRGADQDCGRSVQVNPDVNGEGTTTLCRRQPIRS